MTELAVGSADQPRPAGAPAADLDDTATADVVTDAYDEPRSGRAAILVTIASVPIALVVIAVIVLDSVAAATEIPDTSGLTPGSFSIMCALAQLIPGLLLLRRLPRHPVAWVLMGSGLLWLLASLAASWSIYAIYVAPGTAGASFAYWVYLRFGAVLLLGLPVLLLLFPDGRLPTGRVLRPLSIAGLASTALLPLALWFVPAQVAQDYHGLPTPPEIAALSMDPISVPLPFWPTILTVAYAAIPLSLVIPLIVVVTRYRASSGVRRLQLRWLVWAGWVDALLIAATAFLGAGVQDVLLTVAVAVTSTAIVIAVARYRLYEVDRLLPTTAVSALVLALFFAVDLLLLAFAGSLLPGRDSALVAVTIVAVLYTPLRNRLWTIARRLTRGSREDPYAAVSTLAERLELADDADQQLATVARSVARAFRLPYVRVEISRPDGERAHVDVGTPSGPATTLPIMYRGEQIGSVVLCAAGRRVLSDRDQRLFGDLVRQAATAARASELSITLQRHREQLVSAREEERRRLRRDLHDSLGPSLAAVTLRIETARNLASRDPAEADALLAKAVDDVSTVLADVRRLVHDLRPPALDELGLRAAISQQADRLTSPKLEIIVTATDLGQLPAAVEVAAYRIASEALANVVKHAAAGRCEVRLHRRAGVLAVEIADDGTGIGPDVVAGVGTASLRERAAELGGHCSISCPAGGGTVVAANLPIAGVVHPRQDTVPRQDAVPRQNTVASQLRVGR